MTQQSLLLLAKYSSACSHKGSSWIFSPGANTERLDYVTMASLGDSVDYGDLTNARRATSTCASQIPVIA